MLTGLVCASVYLPCVRVFACVPPEGFGGDSQPDKADEAPLPLCLRAWAGQVQYMAAESLNSLSNILLEVQDRYSEVTSTLNLVLFEDAMARMWVETGDCVQGYKEK